MCRPALFLLCLVLLSAGPALAQADGCMPDPSLTHPRILLKYGEFDPLEQVPAVHPGLAGGEDTNLWLVQFKDFPSDRDREGIVQAGGEIIIYMPEKAYLVRISQGGASTLTQAPGVRWVGCYHPAYRLEPELLREFSQGITAPVRKYNFVVANKGTDKPALIKAINAMGGEVVHPHPESILFTASLTGMQLLRACRLDQVLWIDRWGEKGEDMNYVRIVGGADYLEGITGYTGNGIRGHNYEGLQASHPDFNTTPTVVHSAAVANSHGQCTAGILFGNGTSTANARGMLPDAGIYYTDHNTVTSGMSRYQVLQGVVNTHNCFFTSVGWGNNLTTAYNSNSADADDIVFNLDLPWIQSQSNAGATSQPQNSRPEAWAKNTMAVGAVFHYNGTLLGNDSWYGSATVADRASKGFAADGRIKPDLCGWYDAICCSDLTGSAGYASGDYYNSFGGTSAASAMVAGHAGLAIQMFTDGLFNNTLRSPGGSRFTNRPHFTTLKALLIATGRQYPFTNTSTDNLREHQGWGLPNLQTMHENRNHMFVADETDVLAQGYSKSYTIVVAPGTPELKVAMCYNDPMGNPASSIARINDLDLRVYRGSSFYRGNNGLKTATTSTSGGSYDSRDTTEVVIIPNPTAGEWTVSVYARTVAQDSHLETSATDADFGLVVNGGVIKGSCAFYAPDDDPNTGGSNVIPFGNDSTMWRNQKTQIIIRKEHLGLSGPITTLGFAASVSGRHTWDHLRVRMSHVPSGHTLSTVFASNMPSPVTVIKADDYQWVSTRGRWCDLGLQNPFTYDGTSDIVVEFTVYGADHSQNSGAFRNSTMMDRVYAHTWTGSPPSVASYSDAKGLKIKIGFSSADRNVYGTGTSPDRDPSIAMPAYSTTYSGPAYTRGFWFKAPCDFSIVGLRVPDETSQGTQHIEVFRMTSAPPEYSAAASGGSIFYSTGQPSSRIIPTNLKFSAGDYVGILGACGDSTMMHNSYGPRGNYLGSILGHPVTLTRFITQNNLAAGQAPGYSSSNGNEIGRVEVYVKNELPMPAFSSTYAYKYSRGFCFQTPVDFTMIGLRVPDESGQGTQTVEVFKMTGPPATYPATSTGGQVFYKANHPSNSVVPMNLSFQAGDYIGVLGVCGSPSMAYSSYGSASSATTLRGHTVTLNRFGTQFNINAGGNNPYWTNTSTTIGRVEVFTAGEGFSATAGNMPAFGEPFEILLNGGSPSNSVILNVGTSNSGTYPLDLGFMGITGGWLYTNMILMVPGTTDQSGVARLPFTFTNSGGFLGAKFYVQGLQLNMDAPGWIMASDYLRVVSGYDN